MLFEDRDVTTESKGAVIKSGITVVVFNCWPISTRSCSLTVHVVSLEVLISVKAFIFGFWILQWSDEKSFKRGEAYTQDLRAGKQFCKYSIWSQRPSSHVFLELLFLFPGFELWLFPWYPEPRLAFPPPLDKDALRSDKEPPFKVLWSWVIRLSSIRLSWVIFYFRRGLTSCQNELILADLPALAHTLSFCTLNQ